MGWLSCCGESSSADDLNHRWRKGSSERAVANPKVAPDIVEGMTPSPSSRKGESEMSYGDTTAKADASLREDGGAAVPLGGEADVAETGTENVNGQAPAFAAAASADGETRRADGESHVSDPASQPSQPSSQQVSFNPLVGVAPSIAAQTFTFRELERATGGFSKKNFVGEGGFGRVYKGKLESTGQIVAVKQLDRNGMQGNREFLVEVLMLSLLHHPHLVNLIGYCADGDQRLLVYEFMANGALEDHLHDLPEGKEPLEWNMRMHVAAGAAKGLEYLHVKANPPVIYRDFKSSNILLDESWHPKLSDFGLAKLGPVGDKTHVSTRVMGTYGYCAPEYAMTGQLTVKSDVYSFGVVLLELITGRRAIDMRRRHGEHNLVAWARPLFKDRRKFPAMADPGLRGRYPMRGLYQALAVAAMCLQEQAAQRPMIGDVVTALSYLANQPFVPDKITRPPPGTPQHNPMDRRSNSSGGGGGGERKGSRSPAPHHHGGVRRSALSPMQSPDVRHMHHHHMNHHRFSERGEEEGGAVASGSAGGVAGSASPMRVRGGGGYREGPVGYRESPGHGGVGSGGRTPKNQKGYGENWRARGEERVGGGEESR
ncbi:unnamed protein product [Closterium sp. Yama58-4]|nr:unnamed protein product [Closterium sp. Yama58-4]